MPKSPHTIAFRKFPNASLPAETELMVNYNTLEDLIIEKRADQIRLTKKEPLALSPGFSLREMLA